MTVAVSQTLLYYRAFKGDSSTAETQSSGAYVFRSNGTDPVAIGDRVKVQVVKVCSCRHSMFHSYVMEDQFVLS